VRGPRNDERGVVLPLFCILLVVLFIMTALVVDGGNARQQHRQAQAAVDAGALAGAKSLDATLVNLKPTGCQDVICSAAYYTFQSLSLHPPVPLGRIQNGAECSARTGETCFSHSFGGKVVAVTWPYSFGGAAPTKQYVHVRTCWDSANSLGQVANINFFRICASGTARNTGTPPDDGGTDPPPDCLEDVFADPVDDSPALIPDAGTTIKAGVDIGAHFDGRDSNLDLNSVVFKAPNAAGQTATLAYDPTGKNGYTLTPAPPAGGPYAAGKGVKVAIAYTIPAKIPKNDSTGNRIIYKASLHAADLDQASGASDCGNASFTFTSDGKGLPAEPGACGEDSFLAGGLFPSNGVAKPGDPVYAIYVDESPLQKAAYDATLQPFGIQFTLSGPGWDATGNPVDLTKQSGYSLTDVSGGKEKYGTRIQFTLPDSSKFVNGATYSVFLKAYDTDNNKPGNDCGIGTWKFVIQGGTGSVGGISLVE
jgi:hypothetical protein